MATTKATRTAKAKKPVFPIRPLFLLVQKFHLLVIDNEAFLIKGKEHKHISQKDYEALLSLAWITPAHVIAEGLLSHEVTPLGQSIAAQIEEQNRNYQQLKFDLPELEGAAPQEQEQFTPSQPEQIMQVITPDPIPAEPEQSAPTPPATTSQSSKRPSYQSEEAKAARAGKRTAIQKDMQQAVSTLLAEIKAGKSEHLLNYLKCASKFHQYSPLNQMLIAEQAPNATRVAGYSQRRIAPPYGVEDQPEQSTSFFSISPPTLQVAAPPYPHSQRAKAKQLPLPDC
jgi:hypothetical protein